MEEGDESDQAAAAAVAATSVVVHGLVICFWRKAFWGQTIDMSVKSVECVSVFL